MDTPLDTHERAATAEEEVEIIKSNLIIEIGVTLDALPKDIDQNDAEIQNIAEKLKNIRISAIVCFVLQVREVKKPDLEQQCTEWLKATREEAARLIAAFHRAIQPYGGDFFGGDYERFIHESPERRKKRREEADRGYIREVSMLTGLTALLQIPGAARGYEGEIKELAVKCKKCSDLVEQLDEIKKYFEKIQEGEIEPDEDKIEKKRLSIYTCIEMAAETVGTKNLRKEVEKFSEEWEELVGDEEHREQTDIEKLGKAAFILQVCIQGFIMKAEERLLEIYRAIHRQTHEA